MNQILRCDWLPERARCSSPAYSGQPAVSHEKTFPESHVINAQFIDQACLVKMAEYWPRSPYFLRVYGPGLRLGP